MRTGSATQAALARAQRGPSGAFYGALIGLVAVILGLTGLILWQRTAMPRACREQLDETLAAITAGDLTGARTLWDDNIATYPTGRARIAFDRSVTGSLMEQAELFCRIADSAQPLTPSTQYFLHLDAFPEAVYTAIEAGINRAANDYKNQDIQARDIAEALNRFNATLDMYGQLAMCEGPLKQVREAVAPVVAARKNLAEAERLRETEDLVSAAEHYKKVDGAADPRAAAYVESLWPQFTSELVGNAKKQARAAADKWRYANAISLLSRTMQYLPDNRELAEYKQEIEKEYALYENNLVSYTGPVEHLFSHNLVTFPEGFKTAYGFDLDNDCLTSNEFRKILEQLYENGYMLIDINLLYDGTVNPAKARQTLRLPKGKKPLVLSFDDVNYYSYNRGKGMCDKLVVDDNGMVCGYTEKENGEIVYSYDEHIPLLEKFIEEHPDFSFNNARATIAVTGFDNVFGYYCRLSEPPTKGFLEGFAALDVRMKERAEAKKVADRLLAMGWTFASHSYGHMNLPKMSEAGVRADSKQWRDEIETIVGPTNVMILGYGARCEDWSDPRMTMFKSEFDFSLICGVGGGNAILWEKGNYVFMDRRALDGYALRNRYEAYKMLFNTQAVYDTEYRLPRYDEKGMLVRDTWGGRY